MTIKELIADSLGKAFATLKANMIPKTDIVTNATTNNDTKVAAASVAKNLQDQIGTVPSGSTLQGQITELNAKFTRRIATIEQGVLSGGASCVYNDAVATVAIVVQLPAATYSNTAAMWTLPTGVRPADTTRFLADVGGQLRTFVVTTEGAIRPNSVFTLSSAAWMQASMSFAI